MNITDVNKRATAKKPRKRVGRGAASGLGKTSGRGNKGLGSREGANYLKGFIGGQTKVMTRLPKRGFNNKNFRTEYLPVNLGLLEERFGAGEEVSVETLKAKGVTVKRGALVKILGRGELTKKLAVKAHAFSGSAKEKIEKAGGSAEVLAAPKAE